MGERRKERARSHHDERLRSPLPTYRYRQVKQIGTDNAEPSLSTVPKDVTKRNSAICEFK
jgi:hypothetical protein